MDKKLTKNLYTILRCNKRGKDLLLQVSEATFFRGVQKFGAQKLKALR